MTMAFVFLGLAAVYCLWQVSLTGYGESYELVGHGGTATYPTLIYRVRSGRGGADVKIKTIDFVTLYTSMSTREMEWTNDMKQAYLSVRHGETE